MYNPIYYGYGSYDNVTYNKIDMQNGSSMQLAETALYDNTGNYIATAWSSGIGRVDGERDGGLIAGSLSKIRVNGVDKWMTYAWSVNTREGGRQSGWIDISALSPYSTITGILNTTKEARMALFNDRIAEGSYTHYTIQDAALPSYMQEYYLDPGRDASYTAGKAKYYYTRDGLITLINNIPETGSQRYGVGHDIASAGANFYRDMTVPVVAVNIYPPSSYTAESHTLNLVWGYAKTSAGDVVYSWVNERTLQAVPETSTETVTLHQNYSQRGEAYTLAVGNYSWLPNAGVPNDDISSVTVPDGYTLVLYQHANYRGNSVTLTSNATLRNFNDEASSARFFKN